MTSCSISKPQGVPHRRRTHTARLVDSPRTAGKANLTIRNFTDLVDKDFKVRLAILIDKAVSDAAFARDWRNRIIAHRDLSLALQDGAAEAVQEGSRSDVKAALASLAAVMHAVQTRYIKTSTAFDAVGRHNGALTLLYLLGDALQVKTQREARLKKALENGSDQEITAALDGGLQEEI